MIQLRKYVTVKMSTIKLLSKWIVLYVSETKEMQINISETNYPVCNNRK